MRVYKYKIPSNNSNSDENECICVRTKKGNAVRFEMCIFYVYTRLTQGQMVWHSELLLALVHKNFRKSCRKCTLNYVVDISILKRCHHVHATNKRVNVMLGILYPSLRFCVCGLLNIARTHQEMSKQAMHSKHSTLTKTMCSKCVLDKKPFWPI